MSFSLRQSLRRVEAHLIMSRLRWRALKVSSSALCAMMCVTLSM